MLGDGDGKETEVNRLDACRAEFEYAWRNGDAPRIEAYLSAVSDRQRPTLLHELLVLELRYREDKGELPEEDEYKARFPNDCRAVEAAFDQQLGSPYDRTKILTSPQDESAHLPGPVEDDDGEKTIDSKTIDPKTLVAQTLDASRMRQATKEAESLPKRLGRYRIQKRLGKGAFGYVLLANDEELHRSVAIKIPHKHRVSTESDLDNYMAEARLVAELDHPNLVPVYDIGRSDDGLCFVVSKYIEGENLQETLKARRLSLEDSVQLLIQIADALDHAHKSSFVHRDVKPANILIGQDSTAYLADFGLAIKEEDFGRGPKFVGTANYMSPEQARGEGHRVDAQSDVYSLGVVMYELLTGRLPYRSRSISGLLDEIANTDVPPPRQRDRTVPNELDRICLKALARRKMERYSTAGDMAVDLQFYLENREELDDYAYDHSDRRDSHDTALDSDGSAKSSRQSSRSESKRSSRRSRIKKAKSTVRGSARRHSTVLDESDEDFPVQVVPKGLRSFDSDDAEFFLRLIPGPRDKYGLPEAIRFWITRIEQQGPESRFTVGLIYGPSGCGKSSFVRAGLIPHLAPKVFPLIIDASAAGTESELRKQILACCPVFSTDTKLADMLTAIRRGKGLRPDMKLLIVIDQFEQWLSQHQGQASSELHHALRQCDGERVQCLLLVRDEFMMGIHRFMMELEIPIEEKRNAVVVDLFDPIHAREVLIRFGHAHNRLKSDQESDLTEEERRFLDRAVADLSDGNKVSPIQLAVFSEMVKGQPWAVSTLDRFGGAHGVGRAFLEENFDSSTAPLEHRVHQEAAQAVLKLLLPHPGTVLRGAKRSHAELLQATQYENRARDFSTLMQILDKELRLITPTDPNPGESQYYQLTHDFMVPPLREWLSIKQRRTRRGRAELRLEECAMLWHDKPDPRSLPSVVEYLQIRLLTRQKTRSRTQQKMLHHAHRYYLTRTFALAAVLLMMGAGANIQWNRIYTYRLVSKLLSSRREELPDVVNQLERRITTVRPILLERLDNDAVSPLSQLKLRIVLARNGAADEYSRPIVSQITASSTPEEIPAFTDLLRPLQADIVELSERALNQKQRKNTERIRAVYMIAAYDANHPVLNHELCRELTDMLLALPASTAHSWIEALKPIHDMLFDPLATRFRDAEMSDVQRYNGATLLAIAGREDPGKLAGLVAEVTNAQELEEFLDALQPHQQVAIDVWKTALTELMAEITRIRTEVELGVDWLATATDELYDFEIEVGNSAAGDQAALKDQATKRGQEIDAKRKAIRALNEQQDLLSLHAANVATALLRCSVAGPVWPLLVHGQDPRLAALLLHRIPEMRVPMEIVEQELQRLKDQPGRRSAALRYTLLLCLGEYWEAGSVPESVRTQIIATAQYIFLKDADAGVHGASQWLLRLAGEDVWMDEMLQAKIQNAQEAVPEPPQKAGWWVNRAGQTMVSIPKNLEGFTMGSPLSEAGRHDGASMVQNERERQHLRKIPRSYAISALEVTIVDYLQYNEEHKYDVYVSPSTDCPVSMVNWYDAARYCNWLSKKEGIPEEQHCYQFAGGICIRRPQYLSLRGYRLPTETEWEYACRALTTTSRYFGESDRLLSKYAWHEGNSPLDRTRPPGLLKPNRWGLFDMMGNVAEWCDDALSPFNKGIRTEIDVSPRVLLGDVIRGDISRILRGGAYTYGAKLQRSAARDNSVPTYPTQPLGFRIAKTLHSNAE